MKDLRQINADEWSRRLDKDVTRRYQFHHRYQIAFNRITHHKPASWLDLGTGNGFLPDLVKPVLPSTLITGIDFIHEVLALSDSIDHRAVVNTDAGNIPFGAESFDYITCLDVLEHVVLREHLLEEAWRILKPGGFLLLSVPNLQFIEYLLALMRGKMPHPAADPRHMSIFTLRFLTELLTQKDFEISMVAGCDASPPFLARISVRYLSKTIVVEARKR